MSDEREFAHLSSQEDSMLRRSADCDASAVSNGARAASRWCESVARVLAFRSCIIQRANRVATGSPESDSIAEESLNSSPLRPDDLYTVLGLANTEIVTDSEIQAAYRRLAFKFHPDRHAEGASVDVFTAVCTAVEILGDPLRRRQYDAYGTDVRSTDSERKSSISPFGLFGSSFTFSECRSLFESFVAGDVGGRGATEPLNDLGRDDVDLISDELEDKSLEKRRSRGRKKDVVHARGSVVGSRLIASLHSSEALERREALRQVLLRERVGDRALVRAGLLPVLAETLSLAVARVSAAEAAAEEKILELHPEYAERIRTLQLSVGPGVYEPEGNETGAGTEYVNALAVEEAVLACAVFSAVLAGHEEVFLQSGCLNSILDAFLHARTSGLVEAATACLADIAEVEMFVFPVARRFVKSDALCLKAVGLLCMSGNLPSRLIEILPGPLHSCPNVVPHALSLLHSLCSVAGFARAFVRSGGVSALSRLFVLTAEQVGVFMGGMESSSLKWFASADLSDVLAACMDTFCSIFASVEMLAVRVFLLDAHSIPLLFSLAQGKVPGTRRQALNTLTAILTVVWDWDRSVRFARREREANSKSAEGPSAETERKWDDVDALLSRFGVSAVLDRFTAAGGYDEVVTFALSNSGAIGQKPSASYRLSVGAARILVCRLLQCASVSEQERLLALGGNAVVCSMLQPHRSLAEPSGLSFLQNGLSSLPKVVGDRSASAAFAPLGGLPSLEATQLEMHTREALDAVVSMLRKETLVRPLVEFGIVGALLRVFGVVFPSKEAEDKEDSSEGLVEAFSNAIRKMDADVLHSLVNSLMLLSNDPVGRRELVQSGALVCLVALLGEAAEAREQEVAAAIAARGGETAEEEKSLPAYPGDWKLQQRAASVIVMLSQDDGESAQSLRANVCARPGLLRILCKSLMQDDTCMQMAVLHLLGEMCKGSERMDPLVLDAFVCHGVVERFVGVMITSHASLILDTTSCLLGKVSIACYPPSSRSLGQSPENDVSTCSSDSVVCHAFRRWAGAQSDEATADVLSICARALEHASAEKYHTVRLSVMCMLSALVSEGKCTPSDLPLAPIFALFLDISCASVVRRAASTVLTTCLSSSAGNSACSSFEAAVGPLYLSRLLVLLVGADVLLRRTAAILLASARAADVRKLLLANEKSLAALVRLLHSSRDDMSLCSPVLVLLESLSEEKVERFMSYCSNEEVGHPALCLISAFRAEDGRDELFRDVVALLNQKDPLIVVRVGRLLATLVLDPSDDSLASRASLFSPGVPILLNFVKRKGGDPRLLIPALWILGRLETGHPGIVPLPDVKAVQHISNNLKAKPLLVVAHTMSTLAAISSSDPRRARVAQSGALDGIVRVLGRLKSDDIGRITLCAASRCVMALSAAECNARSLRSSKISEALRMASSVVRNHCNCCEQVLALLESKDGVDLGMGDESEEGEEKGDASRSEQNTESMVPIAIPPFIEEVDDSADPVKSDLQQRTSRSRKKGRGRRRRGAEKQTDAAVDASSSMPDVLPVMAKVERDQQPVGGIDNTGTITGPALQAGELMDGSWPHHVSSMEQESHHAIGGVAHSSTFPKNGDFREPGSWTHAHAPLLPGQGHQPQPGAFGPIAPLPGPSLVPSGAPSASPSWLSTPAAVSPILFGVSGSANIWGPTPGGRAFTWGDRDRNDDSRR